MREPRSRKRRPMAPRATETQVLRTSNRFRDTTYVFFILLVACLFAYRTFGDTTGSPIIKDAHQNLRAAYHLVHTGVMGVDHVETDKPKPQMRREPVPILAIAAFLALHPAFEKPYTIADVAEGSLTKTVKGVNAFWRFLAAVFFMLLCAELFAPRYIAAALGLAGLELSETFFFLQPAYVDRLMTEIPGATMLLASSWCAVRFVKKKCFWRALALGLAVCLLALTKAAFFYISIVFVALLLFMDLIKNRRDGEIGLSKELIGAYLCVMLAMAATVAPWMIRNYLEFGTAQITTRASDVISVMWISGFFFRGFLVPSEGQVFSPTTLSKRIHLKWTRAGQCETITCCASSLTS